jgi:hypothetical protein
MSQDAKNPARTGLVVAATAAVTLAAAVTAGALFGWVGPAPEGAPPAAELPASSVPAAHDAPAPAPVVRDDEAATARRTRKHHGRSERRRHHEEREHGDD